MASPSVNHPLVDVTLDRVDGEDLKVIVLGGGTGPEAAEIKRRRAHWNVTNLDVSKEAITEGSAIYPDVVHVARSVTEPDLGSHLGEFDVVLVVGLLLWVDRSLLLRAIANVDACVREGGHLGIYDFLPPMPLKVPMHHAPGIYTYKQDYAAVFRSTCLYESVDRTFCIYEATTLGDSNRVLSVDLLRKKQGYAGYER